MSERFDLMVIGGGPAGYLAAERAARSGMRVVLFEKRALGGVCLNEGCIPSKALLNSAKLYEHALHGAQYGIHCGDVWLDQQAVTARCGRVVRTLVNGVKAKLRAAGVTVVMQEAKIDGRDGEDFRVIANSENYSMTQLRKLSRDSRRRMLSGTAPADRQRFHGDHPADSRRTGKSGRLRADQSRGVGAEGGSAATDRGGRRRDRP